MHITSFGNKLNFTINFDHVISIVATNLSTSFIPNGLGFRFRKIESFIYESSKVKFVSEDNFEGMRNLKKLSLQENEIEKIPQDAFIYLKHLTELNLSKNKLKLLHDDTFARLFKLRNFAASHNDLQDINEEMFGRNKNLEVISLKKNRIVRMSMNLENFDKLKRVDLRSNICIDTCVDERKRSKHTCRGDIQELNKEIEKMC